jgi:hypothetical protein
MEITDPRDLTSPIIAALLDWYEARRVGANWPERVAFRVETLPAFILPSVGRADVSLAPFRVYYRAMGSMFRDSLGMELSGRYLDETGLAQAAEIADWYRRSLAAPGPLFATGMQDVDGTRFRYEGGTLPLGTPEDDPRAFIVVEDFPDTDAWHAFVRRRTYGPPAQR